MRLDDCKDFLLFNFSKNIVVNTSRVWVTLGTGGARCPWPRSPRRALWQPLCIRGSLVSGGDECSACMASGERAAMPTRCRDTSSGMRVMLLLLAAGFCEVRGYENVAECVADYVEVHDRPEYMLPGCVWDLGSYAHGVKHRQSIRTAKKARFAWRGKVQSLKLSSQQA